MANLDLPEILALMLIAGGPTTQPARVRWPLHLALRELHDQTGRRGRRDLLKAPLAMRPSADVGIEVIGADSALSKLRQDGVLRPGGNGRAAVLTLDPAAAVHLRRRLMTLPPEHAALLQRAGARWAALVATAAKNRATASASPGSTVSSAMPNRENLPLAEGA